jgi:hypothetical protein
LIKQRDAQPRAEPVQIGPGAVKRIVAGIAAGIGDDQRLSARGDATAQALADSEPFAGHDRSERSEGGHPNELIAVRQTQSGPLGREQAGRFLGDTRQRIPELRPENKTLVNIHACRRSVASPAGRSAQERSTNGSEDSRGRRPLTIGLQIVMPRF